METHQKGLDILNINGDTYNKGGTSDMTTNTHSEANLIAWSCPECGSSQVENVTAYSEAGDELLCGTCLCNTPVRELDHGEMEAFLVAMKKARVAK